MKKTALCVVITVLALCVGTAGALAAGQESGGQALAAERTSYSGGWRWGHMDLDGDGVCDYYGCDGGGHWCYDGAWGCWDGHDGYCAHGGCGSWYVGYDAAAQSGDSGVIQAVAAERDSSVQGSYGNGHGCGTRGGCHR